MIPTLLVHDYILVNKFAYGLRIPFTSFWLLRIASPQRGDIVVFRSPDSDEVFFVKRVIGVPGDRIIVSSNGQIQINGQNLVRQLLPFAKAQAALKSWPTEDRESWFTAHDVYQEQQKYLTLRAHRTIDSSPELTEYSLMAEGNSSFLVPENSLFMMGDNRDESYDSRAWGVLSMDRVLGRASYIWLSCEETLPDINQLCDPKTVRWSRMFTTLR
jgi:signal peptidase I